MATAQIIFQRFFYAKSIVKFKFYVSTFTYDTVMHIYKHVFSQYAAMASLFLAAKIEECNRRLRDVLNVFHHLKQKRKGRYVSNKLYCNHGEVFGYWLDYTSDIVHIHV